VGTLKLRVPRVRDGRFFSGLLEPRKRAERALVATVREANVQGVSTRRLDDLFVGGVSRRSYTEFRSMCVNNRFNCGVCRHHSG
jgi:transposase-like protein